MIANCTAVILAGGESRRMGQDKASVQLANSTLLNRAIRAMQQHFDKLIISVREPRDHLLFPQLCDQGKDRGAIMGIVTALERVDTPWIFVIACDMPFVSDKIVLAMAGKRAGKDAIIPHIDGTLQPLIAFYSETCLPLIQSQIERGERSLKTLISMVDATIISEDECREYDPKLLSFVDLDTREDVVRAEAMLAEGKKR